MPWIFILRTVDYTSWAIHFQLNVGSSCAFSCFMGLASSPLLLSVRWSFIHLFMLTNIPDQRKWLYLFLLSSFFAWMPQGGNKVVAPFAASIIGDDIRLWHNMSENWRYKMVTTFHKMRKRLRSENNNRTIVRDCLFSFLTQSMVQVGRNVMSDSFSVTIFPQYWNIIFFLLLYTVHEIWHFAWIAWPFPKPRVWWSGQRAVFWQFRAPFIKQHSRKQRTEFTSLWTCDIVELQGVRSVQRFISPSQFHCLYWLPQSKMSWRLKTHLSEIKVYMGVFVSLTKFKDWSHYREFDGHRSSRKLAPQIPSWTNKRNVHILAHTSLFSLSLSIGKSVQTYRDFLDA